MLSHASFIAVFGMIVSPFQRECLIADGVTKAASRRGARKNRNYHPKKSNEMAAQRNRVSHHPYYKENETTRPNSSHIHRDSPPSLRSGQQTVDSATNGPALGQFPGRPLACKDRKIGHSSTGPPAETGASDFAGQHRAGRRVEALPRIMPSLGTYRGVWNWDSAFHAVALSRWDAVLAREQLDILFDKQQPNGLLPDMVMEDGRMGLGHTKPPTAVVDHHSTDLESIRKVYPKLVKWGDFWLKNRGGQMDGLIFYAGSHAGNDSGRDNSIRWDGGYQLSRSDDKPL